MDLLVRSKSAAIDINASTSGTCMNKMLFDVYAQRLLRRSDFDEIYTMTGQDNLDGQGTEIVNSPYYQFWHKRSGHTFWVKCEFGGHWEKRLEELRPNQLNSYVNFQKLLWPEKVYMVIGFGGRPLKPSCMFCIPLDELVKNGTHYPKLLEKYQRDSKQPFDYQNGRLV
jgi:hypothetical protein